MSWNYDCYVPQGWQCPVCRRVYSPGTPWCYFCGNEQTVTTTDIEINKHPYTIEREEEKSNMPDLDEPDWWKKWRPPYEFTCTSTAYKPKPNETITAWN